MRNEIKKRLLLSKWREDQDTGRESNWWINQLESTLADVKYWFHEGLVLHRPISDPRVILRKVERCLE